MVVTAMIIRDAWLDIIDEGFSMYLYVTGPKVVKQLAAPY